MSSRPVLASTHPPRAMAAGPPRCPCGLHLLAQLKKAETCATWATREGISWSRGLAYFHVCHTCHNAHWRAYVRGHKSNRHTRPRDADPMAGATKRKANGDLFYLTALAPEFLSAVVRQQAKRFRAIADTAEDPRASGFQSSVWPQCTNPVPRQAGFCDHVVLASAPPANTVSPSWMDLGAERHAQLPAPRKLLWLSLCSGTLERTGDQSARRPPWKALAVAAATSARLAAWTCSGTMFCTDRKTEAFCVHPAEQSS